MAGLPGAEARGSSRNVIIYQSQTAWTYTIIICAARRVTSHKTCLRKKAPVSDNVHNSRQSAVEAYTDSRI